MVELYGLFHVFSGVSSTFIWLVSWFVFTLFGLFGLMIYKSGIQDGAFCENS